jgi:hypothetical protein
MAATTEQFDNWFTYHAPTDETGPKYIAITDCEHECRDLFTHAITHDDINGKLRQFAELVDRLAPDSADKTAAIRCIRIARNALNEALMLAAKSDRSKPPDVLDQYGARSIATGPERAISLAATTARQQLMMARWQANSAIACGGK